jgi:osmotically inducible protein OsmC
MTMKATAYSTWAGSWKQGKGTISTESPTLKATHYSFSSRFEQAEGASPEELLAAAHAGCFNQALVHNLDNINLLADSVSTRVSIEFGHDAEGNPAISSSTIDVEARVPGATVEQFYYCAERARTRCTISKIFNCDIYVNAVLLS